MRLYFTAMLGCCLWIMPSQAQENWEGTPVPPANESAGKVSGNEYIVAQCNRRAPQNFLCTDDPSAVREVFIPISEFARWDTVDALRQDLVGLAGTVEMQGGRIAALETIVGLQGADIAELDRKMERDRVSARQGIAAAVAIGNAPMPSEPGRLSYDINVATFRGEQAAGGSSKYRLNLPDPTAISFGFSSSGRGNQAARVGLSGEF